jgi:RNA polymerase sigma factor (sigma-70 family)
MRTLHELPPFRDRWSYLYLEYGTLDQSSRGLVFENKSTLTSIPINQLSLVMLGPGTTVTHAAVKALAGNNCLLAWTGRDGVKLYAHSTGGTYSARRLIRQARAVATKKIVEVTDARAYAEALQVMVEGGSMLRDFNELLGHLHRTGGGLTDGQLLGRFLSNRDEEAFAALVRRHGPMVLGVCRRVLGDFHDAEDAFQATFLVLARKAVVVKQGSLGTWLYGVAYRTARHARVTNARRRARERPMQDMPHPEVSPAEVQDWRPVLDRELNRLPEKYRAAIVLCDLEGRTRREAACLLKIPEGTLSSRLATGRRLLAQRLTKSGLALSGGILAAALAEGASAQVASSLVWSTAKAAAGKVAAAPAVVVLMQGVIKAMFLKKLWVVGAVLVVALGAGGLTYQAAQPGAQAAPPDKPVSELEALRKENELLKLNLQVVLEKVRAQEAELRELRAERGPGMPMGPMGPGNKPQPGAPGSGSGLPPGMAPPGGPMPGSNPGGGKGGFGPPGGMRPPGGGGGAPAGDTRTSDPLQDAETALKRLREARDTEGQRQAADALEQALEKLKQQRKGDLDRLQKK